MTNFKESSPIPKEFSEVLENPAMLKNPDTLKTMGANTLDVMDIGNKLMDKADEKEGPEGALYGAVGSAAVAVSLFMFFSAPISVPVVAGATAIGAFSGWVNKEKFEESIRK